MSQPDIITEEPVSLSDVHASLENIQERDEELSFRAGKTLDHLNHVKPKAVEDKDAMVEKLKELEVPRLKDHHIFKIIDLQPASVKELAVILSGYTLAVNKDYQEKIIEALNA